jgi:hypothetical protein
MSFNRLIWPKIKPERIAWMLSPKGPGEKFAASFFKAAGLNARRRLVICIRWQGSGLRVTSRVWHRISLNAAS